MRMINRVPAMGPLTCMYEPVWSAAKVVTAVAEAAAGGMALAGYALLQKSRARSRTTTRGSRRGASAA